MFSLFLADRKEGDVVVAFAQSVSAAETPCSPHTFVSTNLLIVAKMSWCPETSSRVLGLYFSTLE